MNAACSRAKKRVKLTSRACRTSSAHCEQPYGNLADLNTERLIVESVEKGQLAEIVDGFLDMLESSAAVYETNGDYAAGIFSSGWCRLMDASSRNLCGTADNQDALASGKWHCHESCWRASSTTIATGETYDCECAGGIRLFAVPIKANEDIVGSINVGYGSPPPTTTRCRYWPNVLDAVLRNYVSSLQRTKNVRNR